MTRRPLFLTAAALAMLSGCVEFTSVLTLGNGISNAITRVAAIASSGSSKHTMLLAYHDGGDVVLALKNADVLDTTLEDTEVVDFTPVGVTAMPGDSDHFMIATSDDTIVDVDYYLSSSPSFQSVHEYPISMSLYGWEEMCDIEGRWDRPNLEEFYFTARTTSGLSVFMGHLDTHDGVAYIMDEVPLTVSGSQCGAVAQDPTTDQVYIAALDDGKIFQFDAVLTGPSYLYADVGAEIIDIEVNDTVVGVSKVFNGIQTVALYNDGDLEDYTVSNTTALTSKKHSTDSDDFLLGFDLEDDGDITYRGIQED